MAELQQVAVQVGMPMFAAKQMADWLYAKQVSSIDQMTNISLKLRERLSAEYEIALAAPAHKAASADGTIKYLFPVDNGHFVEAVYIPDDDRATLCISSQVGCKMGCVFCMTGRQHYTASLTAGEILNQILSLSFIRLGRSAETCEMKSKRDSRSISTTSASAMRSLAISHRWLPDLMQGTCGRTT